MALWRRTAHRDSASGWVIAIHLNVRLYRALDTPLIAFGDTNSKMPNSGSDLQHLTSLSPVCTMSFDADAVSSRVSITCSPPHLGNTARQSHTMAPEHLAPRLNGHSPQLPPTSGRAARQPRGPRGFAAGPNRPAFRMRIGERQGAGRQIDEGLPLTACLQVYQALPAGAADARGPLTGRRRPDSRYP
jgi:hypothetical protein